MILQLCTFDSHVYLSRVIETESNKRTELSTYFRGNYVQPNQSAIEPTYFGKLSFDYIIRMISLDYLTHKPVYPMFIWTEPNKRAELSTYFRGNYVQPNQSAIESTNFGKLLFWLTVHLRLQLCIFDSQACLSHDQTESNQCTKRPTYFRPEQPTIEHTHCRANR